MYIQVLVSLDFDFYMHFQLSALAFDENLEPLMRNHFDYGSCLHHRQNQLGAVWLKICHTRGVVCSCRPLNSVQSVELYSLSQIKHNFLVVAHVNIYANRQKNGGTPAQCHYSPNRLLCFSLVYVSCSKSTTALNISVVRRDLLLFDYN